MRWYQTYDENIILITGNFSIHFNFNSRLSTTALNWYLWCFRENKIGKIVNEKRIKNLWICKIFEFRFLKLLRKYSILFSSHTPSSQSAKFHRLEVEMTSVPDIEMTPIFGQECKLDWRQNVNVISTSVLRPKNDINFTS